MHLKMLSAASTRVVERLGVTLEANEGLFFVDYADFDVRLGTLFPRFKAELGELRECKLILKHIVQAQGLSWQVIPAGHKTVCKFGGINSCPLLQQLPVTDNWQLNENSFIILTN